MKHEKFSYKTNLEIYDNNNLINIKEFSFL